MLRFANGLFDAMWNRDHVRAVQIDVPERLGVTDRAHVLRRDRRGARHARHAPVPDRRRGRDGTAGLAVGHRPAGRPRGGDRQVPQARPRRGRPRPVRRLPRHRRHRRPGRAPTPSSPPGSGSTASAGRACRSCCAPASGWRRATSGSASSCASRRARSPGCRSTATCSASNSAGPVRSPSKLVAKRPGAELSLDVAAGDDPARPARRRRPAAALRPAHPRRAARRPFAVHPPGRVGRGVEGRRPAAGEPAAHQQVRPGLVGTEGGGAELAAPDGWLLGQ